MDIKEILEKALSGRAVVLRNGEKTYVRHIEKEIETEYPVIGFMVRSDGSAGIGSWTLDGRYSNEEPVCELDIVGFAPIEFDYWHTLNEKVVAVAKDADGTWYAYGSVPKRKEGSELWIHGYPVYELIILEAEFPDCDWKDSLIIRPGYEAEE